MLTLKEYDTKLKQLRNTRKMTRTMQMVSANKYRKAQAALKNGSDFASSVRNALSSVASSVDSNSAMPLFAARNPVRNALVIVISSDRGLCGGFNSGVCRKVLEWTSLTGKNFEKVDLSFCGRRGYTYVKSRVPVRKHYEGITAKPDVAAAFTLGLSLQKAFLDSRYDEVYLAYNTFKSAMSQQPVLERLLPVDVAAIGRATLQGSMTTILEPDPDRMVGYLAPQVVCLKVFEALLNNAVGEHSARMAAMEKSTRNADQLIDNYTLLKNKARQAQITNQLIEVVSGAEALKV